MICLSSFQGENLIPAFTMAVAFLKTPCDDDIDSSDTSEQPTLMRQATARTEPMHIPMSPWLQQLMPQPMMQAMPMQHPMQQMPMPMQPPMMNPMMQHPVMNMQTGMWMSPQQMQAQQMTQQQMHAQQMPQLVQPQHLPPWMMPPWMQSMQQPQMQEHTGKEGKRKRAKKKNISETSSESSSEMEPEPSPPNPERKAAKEPVEVKVKVVQKAKPMSQAQRPTEFAPPPLPCWPQASGSAVVVVERKPTSKAPGWRPPLPEHPPLSSNSQYTRVQQLLHQQDVRSGRASSDSRARRATPRRLDVAPAPAQLLARYDRLRHEPVPRSPNRPPPTLGTVKLSTIGYKNPKMGDVE